MRIKPARLLERIKTFYNGHEPACTAGFFAAGFLFDILAVGRIDRLHNVIHQATYLSLCAFFTGLELRERYGRFTPPERLKTAWRYHVGVTHFMLGTLLNIYTLFYFKSASLCVSLVFLLVLISILAINEMKPFKSSGVLLRMSLFSLCLVSYFTYLVPMLAGRLGTLPFLGSLAVAPILHLAQRRRQSSSLLAGGTVLAATAAMNLPQPGQRTLGSFTISSSSLLPPVPGTAPAQALYNSWQRA